MLFPTLPPACSPSWVAACLPEHCPCLACYLSAFHPPYFDLNALLPLPDSRPPLLLHLPHRCRCRPPSTTPCWYCALLPTQVDLIACYDAACSLPPAPPAPPLPTHKITQNVANAPSPLQVDLIVCYDATSSPTRSIQRMGRTGRHREGRVVYILAAGREAEQYAKIEEVWVLLCVLRGCGGCTACHGHRCVVALLHRRNVGTQCARGSSSQTYAEVFDSSAAGPTGAPPCRSQ